MTIVGLKISWKTFYAEAEHALHLQPRLIRWATQYALAARPSHLRPKLWHCLLHSDLADFLYTGPVYTHTYTHTHTYLHILLNTFIHKCTWTHMHARPTSAPNYDIACSAATCPTFFTQRLIYVYIIPLDNFIQKKFLPCLWRHLGFDTGTLHLNVL